MDKKYDTLNGELKILQNEMKDKEISIKMMKIPQNVVIEYLDRKGKKIYITKKKRKMNERWQT